MPTATKKTVPAKAFNLQSAICEFTPGDQANPARGPIKLTASSGEVFNHPYWGPMAFDYSGMKLSKSRVTLDYCHRQDEVVGYADKIDTSAGNLTVAGELVSVQPDDRAAEIMAKGAAGVPYEASIKFDPYNGLVVEEYQAGAIVQLNGGTELGPLTVIRQCLLRGVAVCPYGSDPYTNSEFSAAGSDADVTLTINLHSEETEMSKETTTPETKTPEQIRTELVTQTKDYSDRFGVELAAKWGPLGENKPLLECYAEFTAQLRTAHEAALTAKDTAHAAAVAELQTKLTAAETKASEAESRIASLSLGEDKPVSGGAAKTGDGKTAIGASPAAAAFADEFTLPQSKSK